MVVYRKGKRRCGKGGTENGKVVRSPAFRRQFRCQSRLKPVLQTTLHFSWERGDGEGAGSRKVAFWFVFPESCRA
jgi:hypothetical protein